MFKFLSGNKNKSKDKSSKNQDNNLPKDYDKNLNQFKTRLKDSDDIVFREFVLGADQIKCALVYIDGLVDNQVIHQHIMLPLMQGSGQLEAPNKIKISKENAYQNVKNRMLGVSEIKEVSSFEKAMFYVMSGETAIIVDDADKLIIANTRGWPQRSIDEPQAETVIRGPREGFIETLKTNTTLLRRGCRDPNLVVKNMQIGRRSQRDVAITYIKGIANDEIVNTVQQRLNKIDIDAVISSGDVEHFIEDSFWSPFPQIQSTEKPEKAVSSLMEGRVVIVVDGSPFVLIVPAILSQFLQSSEDYFEKWHIALLVRSLRWLAIFLALFAPALYIAVVSFHPGMLPTSLAIAVSASRENLPFPAILEAGLMELTIELLREAGARLPRPIGQTIGIVGGIIIGDAAVRAGIASPILIVIVAVTAIASFTNPAYNLGITFRILRFPMMILAAILGLYGVVLGFILLVVHIAHLKSFGINYNAPFMPIIYRDFKDTIIRVPDVFMNKRPESIKPANKNRQPNDQENRE